MTIHSAAVGLSGTASGQQLHLDAAGGLLVLLADTGLSVFKPWGMTAYARRQSSQAVAARPGQDAGADREAGLTT
jgi:hypothetical protein